MVVIHSLVWDDPPKRANPLRLSLAFTGVVFALMGTIAVTDWLKEQSQLAAIFAIFIGAACLSGVWLLVSLRVPHRDLHWKVLLPGALLFGIGFELLHAVTLFLLQPKLEKASALYGSLGAVTTILFWFYLVGRLVVTSPILNHAVDEERRDRERSVNRRPTVDQVTRVNAPHG